METIVTRMRALALATLLLGAVPAAAQTNVPGLPIVPLGYCQMTSLGTAAAITAANCARASFTATGSGKNLTASSVTGTIRVGDVLAGTGVPAGTYVASQTSGTVGGAGVYVTSIATTSSAASLTSGGVPIAATSVYFVAEAQAIRYRDDGPVPTASIGQPVAVAVALYYAGTLSALRFIEQTSGAKLNLLFYR